MSLAIDVDHVTHVLLTDGWHEVANASFAIDAYEFLWWGRRCKEHQDPVVLHGGGNSGICATGFSFEATDGSSVAGPLTAIVGVRRRYEDCGCDRCTAELEDVA